MDSSSTLDHLIISQGSTTAKRTSLTISSGRSAHVRPEKKSERAVYAYIQAIRVLGGKQVNTEDIADALSMPIGEVERAVRSLRKKGVKAINA